MADPIRDEATLFATAARFTQRDTVPPVLADADEVTGLRAQVRDLTEKNARLEARVESLSALVSLSASVMRNPHLKAEGGTAVVLGHQFANRETTGDPGADGLYPIPLARIAEARGISEDSASKHIATLVGAGALRKSLRWEPEAVNPETGEVTGGHKRQYIGPVGTANDFMRTCTTLSPKRVRRDGTPQTNWGGSRTTCPDHPQAGSVLRWSLQCAACNRILDSGTGPVDPTTGPNPQDAVMVAERCEDVVMGTRQKPQDAGLVSIDDQCCKDVLRGRTNTAYHNEEPEPAEPVPFTRPVGSPVWLGP
jgi:hypothetical protein